MQTTEALTCFFPDDCATVAGGASDEDECERACARCVCCARRPPSLAARSSDVPLAVTTVRLMPFTSRVETDTPPRDVFHVPKPLPRS